MIVRINNRTIQVLIILLSITFSNTYAQFQNHSISINAKWAIFVYAADLDGDGDLDVISASRDDHKIAWYENTDGLGTFGVQQIITDNVNNPESIYAADIDGDGDYDVLSATYSDGRIAWYENTNGLGSFGAQQIITLSADEAQSVYAIDIDGDGDMDVVSASDVKVAWYKNTDGKGNFGAQQIIADNTNGARSVFAVDIDGDGDADVLSAYYDKITWHENTDGLGNFSAEHIITTDVKLAYSVFASDIDGDGDVDVLSASWWDDKVAWYENIDGQGNFSTQKIITTNLDGTGSLYAIDMDGDSDIDVLAASFNDSKIVWFENIDGLGTFGTEQIVSTSALKPLSVYAADIDNDGDADVLSASRDDNKIAWYENTDNIPDNDVCSEAYDITLQLAGATYYTNTQNAKLATNNAGFIETCGTNSTGENGNMNDGVWYYFNALYSREITIYVIPYGSWDAELGVYTGSCADLTCLNSADNATNGGLETLTFPVKSGTNYYINVGSWMPANDGAEGPFDISISYNCDGTAPPNNSIADAVQVTVESFTDNNVNIPCAKSEGSIFNTCNEWYAATYDVFYKFKATNASTVTATITNPTNFPAVVFYEAPDLNAKQKDLTHVNQASNPCGFGSTSSITTQAGRNYYLFASNGSITDISISGVSYSGTKNISITGFKIYPNPAKNTLYLEAYNIINFIGIYNILGQKIVQSMPNTTKAQLDLSSLSMGIYTVKVSIDNQTSSYNLIKK